MLSADFEFHDKVSSLTNTRLENRSNKLHEYTTNMYTLVNKGNATQV